MANQALPRGTSWPITITIKVLGQPIDITGHHVQVTVRQVLIDGTVDSVSPPVWQGDNRGIGGVTLLPQTGATIGKATSVMPPSATQSLPNVQTTLYYDVVVNDGAGNIFQTEEDTFPMTPRVGVSQPAS